MAEKQSFTVSAMERTRKQTTAGRDHKLYYGIPPRISSWWVVAIEAAFYNSYPSADSTASWVGGYESHLLALTASPSAASWW